MSDERFYGSVSLILFLFVFLYVAGEYFTSGWFYVGFILFGFPLMTIALIFWYDVIIKIFKH